MGSGSLQLICPCPQDALCIADSVHKSSSLASLCLRVANHKNIGLDKLKLPSRFDISANQSSVPLGRQEPVAPLAPEVSVTGDDVIKIG